MNSRVLKRVMAVVALVLLPFLMFDLSLKNWLFDRTSYSNSHSIDDQLKTLSVERDWNVVFLGSSEVRWGIRPDLIDDALDGSGVRARSFNLGFDGFSPGLWYQVFPRMRPGELLPKLRLLVVGVNLAESNYLADDGYQPGACGALQRPVLTSAFGKDFGLDVLCTPPSMLDPVERVFARSAIVRYRQPLRSFLLLQNSAGYIPMQSNALAFHRDGFQPHLSIEESRENFDSTWKRLLEEKAEHPERFSPLDSGLWPDMVDRHDFFGRWNELAKGHGWVLAFFALPTNPLYFDVYARRADYARNSERLRIWADAHDVPFFDLGIQDQLDRERDYSDHRHLSQYGARVYSIALGRAMAADARVVGALKVDGNGDSQ